MRLRRFSLGRRTVRLRLTLLYGALFLACGTVLVAITYALASQTPAVYTLSGPDGDTNALAQATGAPSSDGSLHSTAREQGDGGISDAAGSPQSAELARRTEAAARAQRTRQLHALLTASGIALAITTVISLGVGWIVARHLLKRLQRVTAAARTISAGNLHERLQLDSPDDELKELGDTFDQLLTRLEASFVAQRQFIANVSHELRTPMTRQRTLAQLALSDPEATVDSLRVAHERVLTAGERQEQLILALLTLARGQAGISRREPFDLTRLTEGVVLTRSAEAVRRKLTVRTDLGPADASGDAALAERVVINLVDNALRHNVPGGLVEISTRTEDGQAVLTVANTGRPIEESAIARLFQPFERLDADRTGHAEGLGLGLSIVQAIAEAHGATIHTRPRLGGGLVTSVTFPEIEPTDTRRTAGARAQAHR